MCGLGGPKQQAVPQPPAMAPEAPDASRQTTVTKDDDVERQRRLAAGQQGTILSGSRGLTGGAESGATKTLLGG